MNSGFLLINKEKGISSQKVDTTLKHNLKLNKVGHLGTLDPLADGLLVIGINDGTKYLKYFENLSKTYIFTLLIGATSDSLDLETELKDFIDTDLRLKENYIDKILNDFPKVYMQTPPIYSAIKKDGIPLYKYAIHNKDVEIKERLAEIYDIERISEISYLNGLSYVDIKVHVSKGFYIRSFARDLGLKLGLPTTVASLKRTTVGKFNLESSSSLSDASIDALIDPLSYLDILKYEISGDLTKKVLNGIPLKIPYKEDLYLITNKSQNLAIYKYDYNELIYRMDLLIKR